MGRQFHCQIGPRNAVLFSSPGTEVGELATFGAEGAPVIAFPDGGLLAKRTFHTRHHTIGAGYRSSSAWADLVARSCLQQTVQSILIEFGQTEKLDTELAVFTPSDGGGFDRNRRTQVGGANENSDSGTGLYGGHTGHGTASRRKVEHGPFTNRRMARRGKINLQINRDSRMLSAFNHDGLLVRSKGSSHCWPLLFQCNKHLVVVKKTCKIDVIGKCVSGWELRRWCLVEDFYSHGFLLHLFDKADIGSFTDNGGEL